MRIAVYGDSMTEYLHQPPRALAEHLARLQPPVDAQLFNYGVGATRAELVLYRLRYEYWHGRQRMQPLPVLLPDILVLESCAFNNSNDQEAGLRNFTHVWDQIIATCRELAPQAHVLLYLTIAPIAAVPDERANRLFFGALPEIFALRHHWRSVYQRTFAQWAARQGLPLVDVRQHVLDMHAQTPIQHWVAADGVHPNPTGVDLISARIAAAIGALPGLKTSPGAGA